MTPWQFLPRQQISVLMKMSTCLKLWKIVKIFNRRQIILQSTKFFVTPQSLFVVILKCSIMGLFLLLTLFFPLCFGVWFQVNDIYHDSSLGAKINVVLVRIIMLGYGKVRPETTQVLLKSQLRCSSWKVDASSLYFATVALSTYRKHGKVIHT